MRLLRPRSRVPTGLLPTTKFDEATGQVYTESTVAIQSSDDRNWIYWLYRQHVFESQPTTDGAKDILHASARVGTRSLRETAIRYLVRNHADITLEIVQSLPITLKCQLWDAIKKRNAVSLDTWKSFSQTLRHHLPDVDLFDFSCVIGEPKSLLHVYTSSLASKQCQFLTSLSISTDVSNSELSKLSELHNLMVLEIACPADSKNPFRIGDRLVRDWHTAALNDGAFPVLRFLRLWDFKEVTDRSLTYIDAFPALAVFELGGCNIEYDHATPPSGWTRLWRDNPSRLIVSACFERNKHLYGHTSAAAAAASRARAQASGFPGYESPEPESPTPTSQTTPADPRDHDGLTFIPRVDMPSFLSQPGPAAWLMREGIIESEMIPDTWARTTHKVCPMVGDIRNDADLANAGFDIRGQAVVRNALVNSVPTISLRLGKKYKISGSSLRMSFIRSELLYPRNTQVPLADDNHTFTNRGSAFGTDRSYPCTSNQVVKSAKKRKLGDVLDSFL